MQEEDPSAGAQSEVQGWLDELRRTGEEVGGVLRETAALVGVEGRLFVTALLFILVLAVALGFVLAGVMVLVGVALVLLLVVHGGLDPVLATVIGMLALLAIAGVIGWRIRVLTRHLRFTHSRRALAGLAGSAVRPEAPATAEKRG